MNRLLLAVLGIMVSCGMVMAFGYGTGTTGPTGPTGTSATINVQGNYSGSTFKARNGFIGSATSLAAQTLVTTTGGQAAQTISYSSANTSGTDTGLLVNHTATAAGTQLFLDLQEAGVSKFSIGPTGIATMQGLFVNGNGLVVLQSVIHINGVSDFDLNATYSQTGTGQQTSPILLRPVYNQTAATSVKNTDILVNRTETSLGTTPGAQRLLDLQVASASKFNVTNKGHVNVNGTAPALTACGTSPTVVAGSNDHAGTFTVGATGTGCVVTFGTAYTNTPSCIIAGQTVSNLTSMTKTNAAITIVGLPGTFDYICHGLNE